MYINKCIYVLSKYRTAVSYYLRYCPHLDKTRRLKTISRHLLCDSLVARRRKRNIGSLPAIESHNRRWQLVLIRLYMSDFIWAEIDLSGCLAYNSTATSPKNVIWYLAPEGPYHYFGQMHLKQCATLRYCII